MHGARPHGSCKGGDMATTSRSEEFHGAWWLKDAPETRVGGVLTFAFGEGGSLRVYGQLARFDDVGPLVILGDLTDGRAITIGQAGIVSEHGQERSTVQEFDVRSTLIGIHLPDLNAAVFTRAMLESWLLPRWIGLPSARPINRSGPSEPLGATLEKFELLQSEIPGLGRLTLGCSDRATFGRGSATLGLTPLWELTPAEPLSLEEVWHDFLAPTLFFMSLATGEPDRIARIRLLDNREPHPRTVEWLDTSYLADREQAEPPSLRPYIPFELVKTAFESRLAKWFDLYRQQTGVLQTYFSGQLKRNAFVNDQFSDTARSMEAWHRSFDPAPYVDKVEYAHLSGLALQALPEEHRDHFRERLKFGNEISLKRRMDRMIQMAGERIADEVARYDHFSRRVVETRNMQVHQAAEGAFDFSELVTASLLLAAIFEGVLVRQVGFGDEELARSELATVRWAYIAQGPLRQRA
jgi:ApeA N-terminal domain 1